MNGGVGITDSAFLCAVKAADKTDTDIIFIPNVFPKAKDISNFAEIIGKNTLVLLPGSVFLPDYKNICLSDYKQSNVFSAFIVKNRCTLTAYADVRLISNDEFLQYVSANNFEEILLPFADCALPFSYGYRSSYAWLTEMRSSLPYSTHLTAVTTCKKSDAGQLKQILGLHNALLIALGVECPFLSIKTLNTANKYAACTTIASDVSSTAVFMLPTRRECSELCRIFTKNGISNVKIDGSVTSQNIKKMPNLNSVNAVVATKSFVPYSIFYSFSQLIFCGLPYSKQFLSRCKALTNQEKPLCLYCENDISLIKKLIARPLDNDENNLFSDVFQTRIMRFNEIEKSLK